MAGVVAALLEDRQELVGHHRAGVVTVVRVPVATAAVGRRDGERAAASDHVLREVPVEPQPVAGESPVIGAQPVQGHDEGERRRLVGARGQQEGPADLDPAACRAGERVLQHRTGLDVGDDAVLAVEAQVLVGEGPAGQHVLFDADPRADQSRDGDPGAAEQDGTSGRHARQSACG